MPYISTKREIYLAGQPFSMLLEECEQSILISPDYEVKVHSVRVIDKVEDICR